MKNRADNLIDLINILRACNNPNNYLVKKSDIFDYFGHVDEIRLNENGEKLL